uniref:Putative secreted protein n=1 Tax=Ixodes ricinus TaxID=34613 RepID=A0A6B0UAW9_IXORI
MTMHWKEVSVCSRMKWATLPMLVLSRAASISSSTKKGAGWKLCTAKRRARAATVFSPPDRLLMGWKRFPGATQL